MKRNVICIITVFLLYAFSAYSQYLPGIHGGLGTYLEVVRVRDTVLKTHLNDDFYVQIRHMPSSVREGIDDYILLKEKDKWSAKHRKITLEPPEGTSYTAKEVVTVKTMDESNMEAFLKAIDIDRLVQGSTIDSLALPEPDERAEPVLGGSNMYAIMICSKGNYRLIEYPHNAPPLRLNNTQSYDRPKDQQSKFISWQSTYLDNLLERFTKALYMENDWIYRGSNR